MSDEFQARGIDEITLWRDGSRAVVSISILGRSFRVLEAPLGELFFESISGEQLRALSRADYMARRTFRWQRQARRRLLLEAAE